ncbi:MAG: SpoIID/LytB domain-containing protein [Oscillospiraceae bacterium]|nr:SpoIID/LytB domain-containing protein [Oscillospiraceae bacterium]
MKKSLRMLVLSLLCVLYLSMGAQAMENDILKVGLKFGEEALFTARLQNYNDEICDSGYAFGYYGEGREFVPITTTTEEKIAVTIDANAYVSGNVNYEQKPASYSTVLGGYHIELGTVFTTYEEAYAVAQSYPKAFVAFIDDAFRVRIGNHVSVEESEGVLATLDVSAYGASIVSPSSTGVVVSVIGTDTVLFEFDCSGLRSLGIQPLSVQGEKTQTWFNGYRYYGGFEYQRTTGGNINVINVVHIEDYVKCVIAAEMSNNWPLEALKAQTVCARTYAAKQTRHITSGFDICSTTDCQAYQGTARCNEYSNAAADETTGVYIYYNGELIATAAYYSCNGGASEDCKNVWGGDIPYLKGKIDPYEASVAWRFAPYNWTFDVTAKELSAILKAKNVDIGTVKNVYISEFTPTGNVCALTFEGSKDTYVATKERCRTLLNGVLDHVNVRSMRYNVLNGDSGTFYVNNADTSIVGVGGSYVIRAGGETERYNRGAKDTYILTANGVELLEKDESTTDEQVFTFTGSGWGHNVGMSQWGAFAMAEQGYSYRDILNFYYTDITLS